MKDLPHTVHFLFFNIKPIVKFLSCYRQQSYECPLQHFPWCIWKPNVASLEKSCCNLKCITETVTGTWRVTAALHIWCFISLCWPTFLYAFLNVLNLRISLSRAFHAMTKNAMHFRCILFIRSQMKLNNKGRICIEKTVFLCKRKWGYVIPNEHYKSIFSLSGSR